MIDHLFRNATFIAELHLSVLCKINPATRSSVYAIFLWPNNGLPRQVLLYSVTTQLYCQMGDSETGKVSYPFFLWQSLLRVSTVLLWDIRVSVRLEHLESHQILYSFKHYWNYISKSCSCMEKVNLGVGWRFAELAFELNLGQCMLNWHFQRSMAKLKIRYSTLTLLILYTNNKLRRCKLRITRALHAILYSGHATIKF